MFSTSTVMFILYWMSFQGWWLLISFSLHCLWCTYAYISHMFVVVSYAKELWEMILKLLIYSLSFFVRMITGNLLTEFPFTLRGLPQSIAYPLHCLMVKISSSNHVLPRFVQTYQTSVLDAFLVILYDLKPITK